MKRPTQPLCYVLAALLLGLLAPGPAHSKDLAQLKVLYVGSERASDYLDFLKDKVAQVEATSRADFKPGDAAAFDVVLLSWPQSDETRDKSKLVSPLGQRDAWSKPTVLLGSAGLNLAVAWKLKGGSGCTCLDPLAYDLRDHEIFERPLKIDRGKMIEIATPAGFVGEIKAAEVSVLPLVDDLRQIWHPGWCTHALQFHLNPDVEFLCGGVNHQTPTSAALWRQGNLLHYGFDQSPAEMNENGRLLLLNSIAYISRFSEDRPIAVTPSIFAGPIAFPRSTIVRWLHGGGSSTINASRSVIDPIKNLVTPETLRKRALAHADADENPEDKDSKIQKTFEWFDENARYLHPNSEHLLQVDDDLVALGVSFDQPEFFAKVIADLQSGDAVAQARGHRLLEEYVPDMPKLATAAAAAAWWKENGPYCFASDAGDYRWYIDPLAKKRGVPSGELRGPKRAD